MPNLVLRLICLFLAGWLFFSPPFSIAAEGGVLPGDVFTAIMLKALNYDRNIDRQAKEKIIVGIVYFSDDSETQGFAGQVKDNIAKVQSTFLLNNKSVEGKVVALERTFDKAKLAEQLKQDNIAVLVVAINDPSSVHSILALTKGMQISSVCGSPGCAQNGMGLEIIQKNNKPRMVINLASAKEEGSDYNSKFLDLCEVIK